MARTTRNNLEQLWAARAAVPQGTNDQREQFLDIFVGALSVHVDPKIWDECLQTATNAVKKSEESR